MIYIEILIFCTMAVLTVSGRKKLLYIGGIFPSKEPRLGNQASLAAATMALHDVNHAPNLLPGYHLNMFWKHFAFGYDNYSSVTNDMLNSDPIKLMILEGCSATYSNADKLSNLVVVSFGSPSSVLSHGERFPPLFQLQPSHTVQNTAIVQLVRKFGWSQVAFLHQEGETFKTAADDLELECKKHGIKVITRQQFLTGITEAIQSLKLFDVRLVVGMLNRATLCKINKNSLLGENYVWVFLDEYERDWDKNYLTKNEFDCNENQMNLAVEGHITIEVSMKNQNFLKAESGISGMTADDFRVRLKEAIRTDNKNNLEGYWEAAFAYDAIWSMSLALNNTIGQLSKMGNSLENFTYTNKGISNLLYKAMNETDFLGVSGRVAFNEDGYRMAWTRISQIINGSTRLLGWHDHRTSNLTWFNEENWIIGKEPQENTTITPKSETVNIMALLISFFSFSSLLTLSLFL